MNGNIMIGVLVSFIGYLQLFFDPIQQLSQLYATYQQGMAALDKIFTLLDTEADIVDAPDAIDADDGSGRRAAGVVGGRGIGRRVGREVRRQLFAQAGQRIAERVASCRWVRGLSSHRAMMGQDEAFGDPP